MQFSTKLPPLIERLTESRERRCTNEKWSPYFVTRAIQVIRKDLVEYQTNGTYVKQNDPSAMTTRRRSIGFLRRKNPSEFLTRTTSPSRGVRFLVPVYSPRPFISFLVRVLPSNFFSFVPRFLWKIIDVQLEICGKQCTRERGVIIMIPAESNNYMWPEIELLCVMNLVNEK